MTKEPWAIIPKFTQQVPVQAALFKDGLFLPIETQKLSAHPGLQNCEQHNSVVYKPP